MVLKRRINETWPATYDRSPRIIAKRRYSMAIQQYIQSLDRADRNQEYTPISKQQWDFDYLDGPFD
jgi:hypothetical protein